MPKIPRDPRVRCIIIGIYEDDDGDFQFDVGACKDCCKNKLGGSGQPPEVLTQCEENCKNYYLCVHQNPVHTVPCTISGNQVGEPFDAGNWLEIVKWMKPGQVECKPVPLRPGESVPPEKIE